MCCSWWLIYIYDDIYACYINKMIKDFMLDIQIMIMILWYATCYELWCSLTLMIRIVPTCLVSLRITTLFTYLWLCTFDKTISLSGHFMSGLTESLTTRYHRCPSRIIDRWECSLRVTILSVFYQTVLGTSSWDPNGKLTDTYQN